MTAYPQFCALARATEILGERWTLLIVRELLLAPRRYTDLKGRLAPVTASVLTERLGSLEQKGIVERYDWPGPVPGRVYRLTADGEGLRPVVHELTRWGARFLFPERPGEAFQSDWLRLVFETYASRRATPPYLYEVRANHEDASESVFVRGGESGTSVSATADRPADVLIEGSPAALLAAMSGQPGNSEAMTTGRLRVEGDMSVAMTFSALFASDER